MSRDLFSSIVCFFLLSFQLHHFSNLSSVLLFSVSLLQTPPKETTFEISSSGKSVQIDQAEGYCVWIVASLLLVCSCGTLFASEHMIRSISASSFVVSISVMDNDSPHPPYPLTVMTTCMIAWDKSHAAEIRKLLINLSSYCFLDVSVRLFLLTSLPPSFWAEISHLLFRCRDVPRSIFLYDDFDQVNTSKSDQIRRLQEQHASAGRGLFYELHIVRINQTVGFWAPRNVFLCFCIMFFKSLKPPRITFIFWKMTWIIRLPISFRFSKKLILSFF